MQSRDQNKKQFDTLTRLKWKTMSFKKFKLKFVRVIISIHS